jgi:predicted RNA-binding Zn-ribbon protein involved in translation (DUF1610 family)
MGFSPELLAPCGLYCGLCAIMIADRDENAALKEKLAGLYGVTVDDLHCKGCKSDAKFGYCQFCPIRNCTEERGFEGCYQCDEWPCNLIEQFPMPVGKKVMMRVVPAWKELGTEAWVESELEHYRCPSCGQAQFRGAKRCRNCKTDLALD